MRRLIAVPLAASLLALAVPAAQSAPTKAYVITAKLTTSTLVLNSSLKVGGTVTGPGAIGSKVRVYIHYAGYSSGQYDYLGYDLVDSHGRYSKKFRPTDSGDTVVKVVKDASSSRTRATKSVNLDTYGWVPLTGLSRAVKNGVVSSHSVQFGAGDELWEDGTLFTSDGRARWDLRKKCTRYSAFSGMDDSSAAGSQGQAKPTALKSSGNLMREGTTVSRAVGDPSELESLRLYAASNHSARAQYLEISTQVAGTGTPAWGIGDAVVYCNLPGGEFEAD